jgi:subtilisin family serine protease
MRALTLYCLIATGWLLFAVSTANAVSSRERSFAAVDAALTVSSTGTIRVLVSFPEPTSPGEKRVAIERAADRLLAELDSDVIVRRRFEAVPAVAMDINAKHLAKLKQSADFLVSLDEGGSGHMREAIPIARLDSIIAANAGTPVKVAVLDSGIAINHADFAGRIVGQACFCSSASGAGGCCPNAAATQTGAGAAADDHGHGTNVTGVLAAGGSVALRSGAGRSSIVSVKVLDSRNGFCCSSDIVAGLDWVLAQHPDTKILNASLGTNALFEGACDSQNAFTQAFGTAINNLVRNGTMVFVSSGNQGNARQIAAPACNANAFAVGATWDANLASQTFLGCTQTPQIDSPTCFTNSSSQVALYAPGAFITSSGRDGGTSTFGGTSQATPLTAACAAALRAEFPGATVAQVRAALVASPTRVVDTKNSLAFPRLDCADARARLAATTTFAIQAGLAGTWFNPATPGQGFLIDVDAVARLMFVAWFTYEPSGGVQRWFTLQANYTANPITLPIFRTVGGRFDQAGGTQTTEAGSATLRFDNCSRGTLTYRLSDGATGTIPLQRLLPGPAACT